MVETPILQYERKRLLIPFFHTVFKDFERVGSQQMQDFLQKRETEKLSQQNTVGIIRISHHCKKWGSFSASTEGNNIILMW